MAEPRPGVFIDLNGTLVLPVVPEAPADYRGIEGAADAVALLSAAELICPVVTVQSKIGKGLFSGTAFRGWFASVRAGLAQRGAFIEGPYICPHPYAVACACKKPEGALYRQAAAELGIDLRSSFVVGDSSEDMEAANRLGCRGVLVRTGWPITSDAASRSSHVAGDLLAAARWIVERGRTHR